MKNIFFLVINILFVNSVFCQSFFGEATYNIQLAEDVFYFQGILEFNDNKSIFSFKKNKKEKWFRENESEFKSQIVFTDIIGHQVCHIMNTENIEVRSFCQKSKPIIYKDTPCFNWKMGVKEKKIQGVFCKNAHTKFRGRVYEVWFAPSIPVSAGPWKFFGLPGLIMQVTDNFGEVFILIQSLNIEKTSLKIISNTLEGVEMSRTQFNNCLDVEWVKYIEKNDAIIARMQAEYPDIEITNNNLSSKKRKATEFENKD